MSVCRTVWALVPVKAPADGKTRLASVLSPPERVALQEAMLTDLLSGLRTAERLSGIAVMSPDPDVAGIAKAFGAAVVQQDASVDGLNAPVATGVRALAARGASTVAVLPGDLPLADGHELDDAIAMTEDGETTVVVPDRWESGTNALIVPVSAVPVFSYGVGSFERHVRAALTRRVVPLRLPSFALDIDLPEDLAAFRLAAGAGGRATRAVLDAEAAHHQPSFRPEFQS